MKTNSAEAKGKLLEMIDEMASNKQKYVKNPMKDFTRDRKITFKDIILINISMGKSTITQELLEWYEYDTKTPTSSGFIQQRDKISTSAYEELFYKFTNSFKGDNNFKGYRLLAVDGSDFHIPTNENDIDTLFKRKGDSKKYNLLHLNALYDVCNKLYTNVEIQPRKKENEHQALISMIKRLDSDDKNIIIADRGYESYNNIAHLNNDNLKYVIRIKDKKGIVTNINKPDKDEFDINTELLLTRKQSKIIKSNPHKYRFLPSNVNFDFLEKGSSEFFELNFRVLRFKLTDNTYETIITNLGDEFTPIKIKELYHLRWGIETSFRELKYSIGLANFHSKYYNSIVSEIFARLIMYNFTMVIALNTTIQKKSRKYIYQINFTNAFLLCISFLRWKKTNVLNIEALILKCILPIRLDRHFIRRPNSKRVSFFIYR